MIKRVNKMETKRLIEYWFHMRVGSCSTSSGSGNAAEGCLEDQTHVIECLGYVPTFKGLMGRLNWI